MRSPDITLLRLEAERSQEQAKLAAARVALAELDEQHRTLAAQGAVRSTVSGLTYFITVVFVVFVAWAFATEPLPPPPVAAPPSEAQRPTPAAVDH